jgi:type IV secretion system protein VirB5
MKTLKGFVLATLITASAMTASPVRAQIPVTDIAAIIQLVLQIEKMVEQIAILESQLSQAKAMYDSMTGGRGMEQLLAGTVRNYLPEDWATLQAAINQLGGANTTLSAAIQTLITANAVLTDAQLGALSPAARQQLIAGRKSAATLQAITQMALETTSKRFGSIQKLVDAIATAKDSKAALDLQARIQAEQGMLQNEQTKLQVLYQTQQAEQWVWQQRTREQAMADVGSLRKLAPMGLH